MRLRALSWNLFHGRDLPPDRGLLTWRSRLLRASERNATHLQVNRDLLPEFAAVLAGAPWDIALLQECPPRWVEALAHECASEAHAVLTSRNSLAPLRTLLARLNPDLIASNEGGSNLTLVRGLEIAERREVELRPGPFPERRAMALTRVRTPAGELCVANLHATVSHRNRRLAEGDVARAAAEASRWAGELPLLLGGDLNLRPSESGIYAVLERRHGLRGAVQPRGLDHLLVRGLEIVRPTRAWAAAEREVSEGGLAIRLSDHAPVEAELELPLAPRPGDAPAEAPG